jgi:hypothetical protein
MKILHEKIVNTVQSKNEEIFRLQLRLDQCYTVIKDFESLLLE